MISKGCEQCAKGGKMVLFVYGYCDQRDCFYCPLGENGRTSPTCTPTSGKSSPTRT